MEPRLPWARWVDDRGQPVALSTQLGVLIAGDDGNIYIACVNDKAYAIELFIKPECLSIISQASIGVVGPAAIVYGPSVPQQLAQPSNWMVPAAGPSWVPHQPAQLSNWIPPTALLTTMYTASKMHGIPARVRTNIGLELFDDLMPNIDMNAWNASPIPLEFISPTLKIGTAHGLSDQYLEYKAKEIKLVNRSTDRKTNGCNRTYDSRMSTVFHSIMSFDEAPAWYPATWLASPGVVFLPSVAEIDWDNRNEVERRNQARRTSQHALENMHMNRSECSWEFDAWRDIFSKVRDDPLLAMDKHEAIFLEEKDLDKGPKHRAGPLLGKHTVRAHRIPDCTFGLSVSKTSVAAASDDTLSETLLTSECLRDLFWHAQSGLVSDPKWLSFELAFPWAVYEAKKTKADPVLAQVQRSSEIYLNMLHDLCLQPGLPESSRTYQNKERNQFQVFSMTSEGPRWKLYVCYRRLIPELPLWLPDPEEISRQYDMKQIWEGDITEEKTAWQLHCLIDQIHGWAVNIFRPFIRDHLEAWKKYLIAVETPFCIQDSAQAMSSSLDSDNASQRVGQSFRTIMEPSLKNETQAALDILDQELSQQELGVILGVSMETIQELPWWSKYAKPEATRQRLLKGQSLHQNIPKTPKKRRNVSKEDQEYRRESKRLHRAYDAQETKQNADKVQSPTMQRMDTTNYFSSPTAPAWPQ